MGKINVDDESDVERHLDKHGIDSQGDIRRANGSHRHRITPTDDAERLDLHAGGSADQVAANMVALESARGVLLGQIDSVARTLEQARLLGDKMNDGHGPVAAAMSATFRDRARSADGVVVALTNYHAELTNVLRAIDATLTGYNASESASTSGLTAQGGA